jgi:hypothetical protein
VLLLLRFDHQAQNKKLQAQLQQKIYEKDAEIVDLTLEDDE